MSLWSYGDTCVGVYVVTQLLTRLLFKNSACNSELNYFLILVEKIIWMHKLSPFYVIANKVLLISFLSRLKKEAKGFVPALHKRDYTCFFQASHHVPTVVQ